MDAAPHCDELSIEDLLRAQEAGPTAASRDWRVHLPDLQGVGVEIRQLRLADAPSLMLLLMSEEVTRFISPPPTTVEGFERFIGWTIRQQAAGRYVCFGVVPDG